MYQHSPEIEAEFAAMRAQLSNKIGFSTCIPKLNLAETVFTKNAYKIEMEKQGMQQYVEGQQFRDQAGNLYNPNGSLLQYADGRMAQLAPAPVGTILRPAVVPGTAPVVSTMQQYYADLVAEKARREEVARTSAAIHAGNVAMTSNGAAFTTYDNMGNMVQVFHAPMNLGGRVLTWQLGDGRFADAAGNVYNSMGAPAGISIDVSRMSPIAEAVPVQGQQLHIVKKYNNGFGVTNNGLMVDTAGRLTGMTEAQFLQRMQGGQPQQQRPLFPNTPPNMQPHVQPSIVQQRQQAAAQQQPQYAPRQGELRINRLDPRLNTEHGIPQSDRPMEERDVFPYRIESTDEVRMIDMLDLIDVSNIRPFEDITLPLTHIARGRHIDAEYKHFDNISGALCNFLDAYKDDEKGCWNEQYYAHFPHKAKTAVKAPVTTPAAVAAAPAYEPTVEEFDLLDDEAMDLALGKEFPINPPVTDEDYYEQALFNRLPQQIIELDDEEDEEEEEPVVQAPVTPAPAPAKAVPNFYVPMKAPVCYVRSRHQKEGQPLNIFPVWYPEDVMFEVRPESKVTGRYSYDHEQFIPLVAMIAMVPREIIVRKEAFMRYAEHAHLNAEVPYPMGQYEGGLGNILADVAKEEELAPTSVRVHPSAVVAASHEEAYAKAIHLVHGRKQPTALETDVEYIVPSGELTQELIEMVKYTPQTQHEFVARYIAIIELAKDQTEIAGQSMDAVLTEWLNKTLRYRCPDLIANRIGKSALEVDSFCDDYQELREWCEAHPEVAGKTMDILVDLFTREIPRLMDISVYNDAYHILNSDEEVVTPRTAIIEGQEPVRENYPMLRIRVSRWVMVELGLRGTFNAGRISSTTNRALWKLVAGAFRAIDENSPADKAGTILNILTGDGQMLSIARVTHAPLATVSELYGYTILNVEAYRCA